MKPGQLLITGYIRTGSSYLVIHDGISQLLNKSSQGFGIINIMQELEECMFFGQWLELCNNPLKLPGRGVSKGICIHMNTNLQSSTLLPFSTQSSSLAGEASTLDSDCTLCSIPFTISILSNVCYSEKQV